METVIRALTVYILGLGILAIAPHAGAKDLATLKANLAFTCSHEADRIPPRDPEADQLYKHARWLGKNNALKRDPAVYRIMERELRIATAYGHDKANLELRNMLEVGEARSSNRAKESVEMVEGLIKRGIPGGYYDMAKYLESGYGVRRDEDAALQYYRKAADLGNPDGQFWVGKLLQRTNGVPMEITEQMWQCAAEQGHALAASKLAIVYKLNKKYRESLLAFQLAIKAGHDMSAYKLSFSFANPLPSDESMFLDVAPDPERVARYKAIEKVLSDYSYLHPTVPELDAIVPLPPAKLPPWNGTLKWLEEYKANIEPPLPSEERIVEMATAKHLKPTTGEAIPQSFWKR